MAHRVAEDVDLELDDIWLYPAKQSGSIDIADHVADSITACFVTLGRNPRVGRRRDDDLALGL
jgi:plasmid stabilization system protein ParE